MKNEHGLHESRQFCPYCRGSHLGVSHFDVDKARERAEMAITECGLSRGMTQFPVFEPNEQALMVQERGK